MGILGNKQLVLDTIVDKDKLLACQLLTNDGLEDQLTGTHVGDLPYKILLD